MVKAQRILYAPEYYITDSGEVYSRKNKKNPLGRIKKMKNRIHSSGYLQVRFGKNGTNKYIHRLVAEAFIPNYDNKPEVNHKNGIKTDNKVENLEWVTRSENLKHSYRILNKAHPKGFLGKRGILNKRSKIIQQIKDNIVVSEYYGAKEAERKTGIANGSIYRCCHGKQKTAGGYKWEFKNQINTGYKRFLSKVV